MKKNNQKDYRINDELKYAPNYQVRIIGEGIESQVLTFKDATKLANSLEKDLIEIKNDITPPILRIASYDKFIYELKKSNKKNKNTSKPLKEIDLSVNIAINDLETKVRKAKEFISDGSKVKVVLTMRGREMFRRETNKKSILEFITMMEDIAIPESLPRDEGNKTTVILKRK